MTVVDASAFVEVLKRPGRLPSVEAAIANGTACAPDLFDAEVLGALVRGEKRGDLSAGQVDEAIGNLQAAPVLRVSSIGLLRAARRLTASLSGLDALYVALAGALRIGLVTADRRLASAPGLGVPVTVVPVG